MWEGVRGNDIRLWESSWKDGEGLFLIIGFWFILIVFFCLEYG